MKKIYNAAIGLLFALALSSAFGQAGSPTSAGSPNFRVGVGTTLPTSCNEKTPDWFYKLDAPSGQRIYGCENGAWVQQGGGGGGGSVAVGSITGLGTGVATALGVNTGSAGAVVVNGGALGTPLTGTATNLSGTAASLTAGHVTTNANLTGPITSTGNATAVAAQTGTGSTFVMQASPALTTPDLGIPSALVGTNITGTAASLTAGHVTTNANLTGPVTSVGNATAIANGAISNAMLANGAVANLSGTNTGDQTITLTGGVTGSGTGSFAATVVTNANLTGPITSTGNATAIAAQTGTGNTFVMQHSPTLTGTPQYTPDTIGGVTIPTVPNQPVVAAFVNKWSCNMQTTELGLSLVDRGYAPAWTTSASVRTQFLGSNPLNVALQRMGCNGHILTDAGKSGDTSAGALSRLTADVFNAVPRPAFVWYSNGGNDINLITNFTDATAGVDPILATYATNTESIWQAVNAAGMGFGIEVLPDNGTWTSNALDAKTTLPALQSYARAAANWRMNRWHKNACRLNGFSCISWDSGFTRAERQLPLASTVNTITSTTTNGTFTMPSFSATTHATVNVTVVSTTGFTVGDFITIATAGTMTITAIPNGTTLTVYSQTSTNAAGGVTIASGSNVIVGTVTIAAQTWVTGDYVFNYALSPTSQRITTATPIRVISTTQFTYPPLVTTAITVQGTWQRQGIFPLLATDGTIHWNANGAFQMAYIAEETLAYGKQDWLTTSEADSQNMLCAGLTAADSNSLNCGMMIGTTGTFTSITNTSGTVPRGWDMKQLAGPSGATVSCAPVAFGDPGRPQMTYEECTFTAAAGTTDTEFSFHVAHTLPTNWAATTAKSVGNWVKPTVQTGLFYIAIAAGTTGGSQPTWPTQVGAQVTDGSVTWEARRAYIADSATKYYLNADFVLKSASSATALQSRAFGLFDDSVSSSSANNIVDGDVLDNVPGPNYQLGEHSQLMTIDSILGTSTTTFDVGYRFWVTQGTSVTLDFGRVGWYVSGCGTGCNPSSLGSLGGI